MMKMYDGHGFALIETLLVEHNEYFLLDLHMERLAGSIEYFNSHSRGKFFECDIVEVRSSLLGLLPDMAPGKGYRVRLVLNKHGMPDITYAPLEALKNRVKIAFSEKRTDKSDIFLRHKTTNRELYDSELKKYRKYRFFDVIFLNRSGEVTEGAISNIIIKKGLKYFTPPASCGLLEGTYRKYLINSGKMPLEEKILYKKDVEEADEIFVTNSVRKILLAKVGVPVKQKAK